MDRRGILQAAGVGALTLAIQPPLWVFTSYAQIGTFFAEGAQYNGLAAVVAGIIGQSVHGSSEIDLAVRKRYYPDARVRGSTSPTEIDTRINLLYDDVHFTARRNAQGLLEGKAEKSAPRWHIDQQAAGLYLVGENPWKNTLTLHAHDGAIWGAFDREEAPLGNTNDWRIQGSYEPQGKVKISIDSARSMGITLDGMIRPAQKAQLIF